jgi:hypothetical protein
LWWEQHWGERESRVRQLAVEGQIPLIEYLETVKAQYQKLWTLKANLNYVDQLLTALWRNLVTRMEQELLAQISPEELKRRDEHLEKLGRAIRDLSRDHMKHREVTSVTSQAQNFYELLRLLAQVEELLEPVVKILNRYSVEGTYFEWLSASRLTGSHRGRPSQDAATFFMVVLSDHLRERTGKPHYTTVGRIALALFPGCLKKAPRRDSKQRIDAPHRRAKQAQRSEQSTIPPKRLSEIVQARCKSFRRSHNIEALRTFLITAIPL